MSQQISIPADLLLSLHLRLQRLEFYISGAHEPQDVPPEIKPTIYKRLMKIEQGIKDVAASHGAYRDLLKFYKKHQELFDIRNVLPLRLAADPIADGIPLTEKLHTINACAPLFPSTVSRLNLLQDSPVPPVQASAALIALGPRLDQAEDFNDLLSEDLHVLRTRSLLLQQRIWKLANISVLGCWAEFEGRLVDVERGVRRREIAKEEG